MDGRLYNGTFLVKAKCTCIGGEVQGDRIHTIFETLDFNYGMK